MDFMPKGYKQCTKIGTQTHQTNAKTGNEKKEVETIKNHVYLNGEIIETHCKNTCFLRFRRLRARTKTVLKTHQK